jgi:hypothetical protein
VFRVIINVTDIFVVASTEHDKSAYVKHNKQKNKKQTKRPQQNMLNQVMSHTTKRQKQKQKSLNRTCVKSGYVTHNKKANTKTKEPQQNMLCQLMSRRCDGQKPHFLYKYII